MGRVFLGCVGWTADPVAVKVIRPDLAAGPGVPGPVPPGGRGRARADRPDSIPRWSLTRILTARCPGWPPPTSTGPSLADAVSSYGPLPAGVGARAGGRAGRGARRRARRWVSMHRDLKPSNVLLASGRARASSTSASPARPTAPRLTGTGQSDRLARLPCRPSRSVGNEVGPRQRHLQPGCSAGLRRYSAEAPFGDGSAPALTYRAVLNRQANLDRRARADVRDADRRAAWPRTPGSGLPPVI